MGFAGAPAAREKAKASKRLRDKGRSSPDPAGRAQGRKWRKTCPKEQACACYNRGMTGETQNSCGDCTVCCKALRIEEFDKQAGVMCQHCTGAGCGIYETRYETCKGFLCGWRILPQLGDSWRPDRSGVLMIVMEAEKLPQEHAAAGNGIQFLIVGGEKAILRPGFAEYIMTLVTRNVAVYLSADSPKSLINIYLRPSVAAKNKEGVTAMLLHIYRQHVRFRDIKKWIPLPWVDMP